MLEHKILTKNIYLLRANGGNSHHLSKFMTDWISGTPNAVSIMFNLVESTSNKMLKLASVIRSAVLAGKLN